MLLNVIDASGATQVIVVQGQETVVDESGLIAASNVSQALLAANPTRSGWSVQNVGVNPMWVNDLGVPAVETGALADDNGSIKVAAGAIYTSVGNYLTNKAVAIIGTLNEAFVCREW